MFLFFMCVDHWVSIFQLQLRELSKLLLGPQRHQNKILEDPRQNLPKTHKPLDHNFYISIVKSILD